MLCIICAKEEKKKKVYIYISGNLIDVVGSAQTYKHNLIRVPRTVVNHFRTSMLFCYLSSFSTLTSICKYAREIAHCMNHHKNSKAWLNKCFHGIFGQSRSEIDLIMPLWQQKPVRVRWIWMKNQVKKIPTMEMSRFPLYLKT